MIKPDTHDSPRYNEIAPYLLLWTSVMKQGVELAALADYRMSLGIGGQFDADLHWFESNDEHVGSFNWICGVLNLDPGGARIMARANFRSIAIATYNKSERALEARAALEKADTSDAVENIDAHSSGAQFDMEQGVCGKP